MDRTPPLSERVRPGRVAVVVVDMQNDFVSPEGANCQWWQRRWATEGVDLSGITRLQTEVVAATQRLVAAARSVGVPVIWSLSANTPETNSRFWMSEGQIVCQKGSWGAELIDDLEIGPGELSLYKTRHSAFFGTPLDSVLRRAGIDAVVVTGTATHGCVEATVRDAMTLDYWAVVAGDCCGQGDVDGHNQAVARMNRLFGVAADSDEILAAWGVDPAALVGAEASPAVPA